MFLWDVETYGHTYRVYDENKDACCILSNMFNEALTEIICAVKWCFLFSRFNKHGTQSVLKWSFYGRWSHKIMKIVFYGNNLGISKQDINHKRKALFGRVK